MMGIDEAGKHGGTLEVVDLRARPGGALDLRSRPHRKQAAPAPGDGLGTRIRLIQHSDIAQQNLRGLGPGIHRARVSPVRGD